MARALLRRARKLRQPPETDAAAPAETAASAATESAVTESASAHAEADGAAKKSARGNRVQKVGTVSSDKMQKTVVVRVDRQVLHPKYRRYVRRTSKFMAHDDLGATVGDRVRIVETRPVSAKKRWRVIEIVQKAGKIGCWVSGIGCRNADTWHLTDAANVVS
jgi:small subunit ribosomal protein S17